MTKVAIFETDHAFAVELRSELSRFGCTVQVFTDGTSGLAAARSNPPDLILVSVELPPVNGFSTCNKIKKDAKLASVPVILMSSESSQETFEQHRRLPSRAEDYVHKPISFADFLPHIRQLIEVDVPQGVLDEDTSMVIDDELLLLDEPSFGAGDDSLEPGTKRRPTLELEIGGGAQTKRRPMVRDDDDEEEDEELVTVVGERPHVPDHLLAQFRAAQQGSAPAMATPPRSQPAPAPETSTGPLTGPPTGLTTGPPSPTGPPGRWSTPAPAGHSSAAPADLQRAKNALQTALAQLNQSRKDTASLRAELAIAKGAQGGDHERLQRELDETKRKLVALGGAAETSERERLELREKLQKRDKELLGLREVMAAKEHEVLAAKDASLSVERSLTELKERLGKLETDKSAANARVEALLADKAIADKRAEDFRSGARKIAEQLNQRAKELHEANETHNAAVERLKREHQAALAKADEKRRKELADVERTHREQIDRSVGAEKERLGKAELTTKAKIETAQMRAREQIERAQKDAQEQIARAQREADEKLSKANAQAKTELDAALAKVGATHKKELEQIKKQLEAANLEAEELRKLADDAKETIDEAFSEQQTAQEEHEKELARLQAEHEKELARLQAAHEEERQRLAETHRVELASREAHRGDTESKVVALRQEHEEAQRALQAENAEALQKAGYDYQEKVLQKEKSFATLKEQLDVELAEANEEIAQLKQHHVRLSDASELERREHDDYMATVAAERDDLTAQVKQLEADGAAMNEKLAALETKLDKARIRWGEERAELKQVKNTLAGLVRTLDETVVKDLDD